jgi:hypothetical protein
VIISESALSEPKILSIKEFEIILVIQRLSSLTAVSRFVEVYIDLLGHGG